MSLRRHPPPRPLKDIPPPINRGMKSLDRSKFVVSMCRVGVRVDAKDVTALTRSKEFSEHLIDIPRRRGTEQDPNTSGGKVVMLKYENEASIPPTLLPLLESYHKGRGFLTHPFQLTYDHWNAADIMDAVLPEEMSGERPTSFTQTGHIAHMNLREEYLPYKYLVGQVIMDKNPGIRTVVNKLDSIDTEFRVFAMEVIAGEPDFIAHLNESDCSFTFDFSRVYWNSRLSHEHERLVHTFSPGEVIADVMAGVGPFAVPAAKKRCLVLGNDLNPESGRWMEVNRRENKVEAALRVSTVDGRRFIQESPLNIWRNPFPPLPPPKHLIRQQQKEARRARENRQADDTSGASTNLQQALDSLSLQPTPRTISHFVMNLPGSALEFLDAYNGCYKPLLGEEDFPGTEEVQMPLVHTHCFTKVEEREGAERDICERATRYLRHPVSPQMDGYNLHLVRSVAPNKDMYCLTFRLPREVAYA